MSYCSCRIIIIFNSRYHYETFLKNMLIVSIRIASMHANIFRSIMQSIKKKLHSLLHRVIMFMCFKYIQISTYHNMKYTGSIKLSYRKLCKIILNLLLVLLKMRIRNFLLSRYTLYLK